MTEAQNQKIPDYLLKQWVGHAACKDDVTEGYNAGQGVRMLLDELQKLQWDVSALREMQQGWRELPWRQRRPHRA